MRAQKQPRHLAHDAEAGAQRKQHQPEGIAREAKISTLRILADETVADLILEPHLAAFLAAHPSLSIEVERRARRTGHGCTEAALILQYVPSSLAEAGAEMLSEQRLVTCSAPQYLRQRGVPHHPHDLRAETVEAVIVSDDLKAPFGWRFENEIEQLSICPHVRAVTPSPSTAVALALAGLGLTQIPECWAIDHVRAGRLIRLLPEWEPSIQLRAITPSGRSGSHTCDFVRFVQMLLETGAPRPKASEAQLLPSQVSRDT